MNVTILLVVASCLITTGCCNTYYVVAPDGASCPSSSSSSSCQELSNYTSQPSVFFTNNTVIYFLEGHHMLHQQDLVMISGVTNLTLQGLSTMETGPHETVIQSTVVIMCSRSTGGFIIMNSQSVTISTITVSGCTGQLQDIHSPAALNVVNSHNTHLHHVSIQNASSLGLFSNNSFNLVIKDSSFCHNQYSSNCGSLGCPAAGSVLKYGNFSLPLKIGENALNIIRSNFSFNVGAQLLHGSGLSIFLDSAPYRSDIYIDRVVAYGNTAYNVNGANIYISIVSSVHTISINNTLSMYGNMLPLSDSPGSFISSTSGAGLFVRMQQDSDSSLEANISISNSNFSHNQANKGAGLCIESAKKVTGIVSLSACNFVSNTGDYGSALFIDGSADSSLISTDSTPLGLYLVDINLIDNRPYHKGTSSLQSTVTIENVAHAVSDRISILNSLTTGLVVLSSTIIFQGEESMFFNNSGIDGGGMALYGSSYIVVNPPIIINLTANHASRYGGGLYVDQPIVPSGTKCFYQSTHQLLLNNPRIATIALSRNTAGFAGSALYGGNDLLGCSPLTLYQDVFFDALFQLSDQPGPSNISSNPKQVCLCSENDQLNCSHQSYPISTFPGSEFSISIATLGNLNGLTPGTIGVNFMGTKNKDVLINTNASCTRLLTTLSVTSSQSPVSVTVSLISSPASKENSAAPQLSVSVNVLPCPRGLEYSNVSGECLCTNLLSSAMVTCDVQTGTINRTGDVWVGYSNETNCTIVSTNCPLDYCKQESVSFPITDPNPQCRLNRSGVLCGGCDNGLSLVLGTNRCAECSNVWLTLLLPFAVAGIALVAFLIALNLTVSVGTINGLIFYANIIKIEESFIFPKKGPTPLLSQFISWINLDLGIEVCFFNGMSSCSKAWLQYAFPIYIWLILAAIVIFARFSKRLLRLVGSHIVPVLSTLLLLSYTKLIRNVILAMYVMHVSCDTASNELAVWFFDGNIRYFTGCHLPLFIVALLVLIFLIIPYTLFLVLSPFIEAYLTGYKCFQWVIRLKPVMDAYGGPYCDKFRVWTGFLLLVRVLLALISSLSDNRHVSIGALMCTMVILLTIHYIAGKVYNKWYLNALEITFLFNLILLGYFEMAGKEGKEIAVIVLLSISFVMLLGIVLYHIALRIKPDISTDLLCEALKKLFRPKRRTTSRGSFDVQSERAHIIINKIGNTDLRESLLDADFDAFIDDK